MKKIFEKALNISLIMGVFAVVFCLFGMSKSVFIFVAMLAGFLGFIMGCLHIIAVGRYEIKLSTGLILLSLFLNTVPLIYVMMVVMQHR